MHTCAGPQAEHLRRFAGRPHILHFFRDYGGGSSPRYVMRWHHPDVTQLPAELIQVLAKGSDQRAAVGNCPPQDVNGPFTTCRVEVLLLLR